MGLGAGGSGGLNKPQDLNEQALLLCTRIPLPAPMTAHCPRLRKHTPETGREEAWKTEETLYFTGNLLRAKKLCHHNNVIIIIKLRY